MTASARTPDSGRWHSPWQRSTRPAPTNAAGSKACWHGRRDSDSKLGSVSMIRVTATPKSNDDVYGLLVAKEVQLRQRNQGTLHRKGEKKRGSEKWVHSSYP